MMNEISYKTVRYELSEWHVQQKFIRLGKYEVTVIGYGATRERAMQDFENQKRDIELVSPIHRGPLDDLAELAWIVAGVIDWLKEKIK